jgi:hypothetical protein
MAGRAGPCDIQISTLRVGGDIIESAIASHELNLEDLVGTSVLSVGHISTWKQKGECDGELSRAHDGVSNEKTVSRNEHTRRNLNAG